MTTTMEGAELTQVGPGTVMGQLMREYWLPALKSSELTRDGDPIRLMLVLPSAKLIAFRDSAGRVGVMDAASPAPLRPLFLGRNEEGGIRCIYHGWKYDVAGNCIDMPSVPDDQDFKHKVKAKAYRVIERAGLVWVYMGERAEAPPLPGFDALDLPPDEINVSLMQRDAPAGRRWKARSTPRISASCMAATSIRRTWRRTSRSTTPSPTARRTTTCPMRRGVRNMPAIAAPAPAAPTGASPISCSPAGRRHPTASSRVDMHARGWVPLDDGHTMFVFIWWKHAKSAQALPQPRFKDGTPIGGTGRGGIKMLPNTTDWLGRWRMAMNESNDWGMDREAQRRNAIYSGIDGIHLQDQAITESMGPVTDFGFEHLAPSDQHDSPARAGACCWLPARSATRANGRPAPTTQASTAPRAAATSSPPTTRRRGGTFTTGRSPRRSTAARRRPLNRTPRRITS